MSLFDAIIPMLLDDPKYPVFSHPDCAFEIKYGGYRMLVEFGTGHARLKTRQGIDCTDWFSRDEPRAREARRRPLRH